MEETPPAIRFRSLVAGGVALPDIEVPCGGVSALILPHREQCSLLVQLLLGGVAGFRGEARLWGSDLRTLRPGCGFRSAVSPVPEGGKLISNLTAWENLVLPLSYHARPSREELLLRGEEVLALLGFSGPLAIPATLLGEDDSRLAALGRSLLLEPRLVACDALLDGLDDQALEKVSGGLQRAADALPEVTFFLTTTSVITLRHLECRHFPA